ncbi:dTDP-4-dehydrorhamnose 3,5-epimerase [Lichenifustis flavocetrariae]|uniref:dTDP-4-dehydrorhamnose 3,5-epimerase n=1 Tax=Lichenifustis flavocetrariae TaxID=2949735 RepID=A0AA41ZA02_9HYPH|nr:dTDP-4-dehydrorhamnose 3,5-epimerase [Lichenifustis flavocetrariae]MCW6513223.1 dTDP-4-dehydrorhamnose 3,5-epimerase [Lichenifustis flavocetrariae]
MELQRTAIPDVVLLTPRRFGDDRGFFSEVFNAKTFTEQLGDFTFVQDNHSVSATPGTVRGLHYQTEPHAQGKLVRCAKGRILDVAVDIRRSSPTFGQHVAVELSAENWSQLWVPPGFAHGFCTLVPDCEVLYKVTNLYAPSNDFGIAFDDPDLGIAWPVARDQAVLSDKDKKHPRLADATHVFA